MLLFILFYQLNFPNTHSHLDSRMKEFADYAQGRNLKSYWDHRKNMKKNVKVHYHSETLPITVINHVHRFFFYFGYARSAHSVIASMLDAHPNVVIVHEYALFVKWEHEPAQHSNKTCMAVQCPVQQLKVQCVQRTKDTAGPQLRRAILLLSLGHGRGGMTLQVVFLLLGTSQGG